MKAQPHRHGIQIQTAQIARGGAGYLHRSDFIVGFPGETEKDFQQTMKLIEDVGFDFSIPFVYSQRPGTPAADLLDETPEELKKSA